MGRTKKDKFVYDNGFNKRHYLCSNCGSHKVIQKPSGGFSPPTYECTICTSISHAPKWEVIPRSEDEQRLYEREQMESHDYLMFRKYGLMPKEEEVY